MEDPTRSFHILQALNLYAMSQIEEIRMAIQQPAVEDYNLFLYLFIYPQGAEHGFLPTSTAINQSITNHKMEASKFNILTGPCHFALGGSQDICQYTE